MDGKCVIYGEIEKIENTHTKIHIVCMGNRTLSLSNASTNARFNVLNENVSMHFDESTLQITYTYEMK